MLGCREKIESKVRSTSRVEGWERNKGMESWFRNPPGRNLIFSKPQLRRISRNRNGEVKERRETYKLD
jgi:hypothetical protein